MTTLYSSLVDCFADQPHLLVNDELEEMCHYPTSDCYLLNEDNLYDFQENSSQSDDDNTNSTTTPFQSLFWSQITTTDTKCQMFSKSSLPKTTLRRHRFVARQKSPRPLGSQHSIHYIFIILFYLLALSVFFCEASKSKRNSWRQYDASPLSSSSNSQQPRLHYMQQSLNNPSSDSADPHHFASSSSSLIRPNYGNYVPSSTSHNRRPPPAPTAAGLQSAYQHYMGNHLLSVPFSPNQQLLYQHQMLPHHSTFPITPTASVVSGSSSQQKPHTIVQKSIPTSGGRNIKMAQQQSRNHQSHQYDVNQEHMLQTNSLRGKSAKWW